MSDRKVTPAPKAYRANVFWDRQDCATLSAQVYLASDADSFIGALLAERDQLRAELEAADEQKERWVAWAKELGEKCDRLEAELAAIRGQQPVAWVSPDAVGGTRWKAGALQQLNDGSPLYALPPQQPDAVSVPRELLERIGKLFPADMEDDGSGRAGFYPHVREAVQELRALLATEPE